MDWFPFTVDLVLGAILGTLLSFLLPVLYKRFRDGQKQRQIRKRQALLSDVGRVYGWLIEYYIQHDAQNDLFDCKIGNYETKIPFLTKTEWQYPFKIPINEDVLLDYADSTPPDFEVDAKLLSKRQRLGQRLFNEPALYLDRIEYADSQLCLCVKTCDYFQIATSMIRLEEETFRAVQRKTYRGTPIREAYLPHLARAEQLRKKPFAIGCAFVLALKNEDSYEVLIHTRSHSTVTFGGVKAATPNFGLAPVRGLSRELRLIGLEESQSMAGQINLLFYNFVKEYLEELFDYEQLIEQMRERRANALWFFELPEAQQLMRLVLQDQLTIEFLGFGFDALNGNTIIAMLGVLDDQDASMDLKRHLKMNWEFASEQGTLEIEAVDVQSPILEQWLRDHRYHAGGAFAISRALERLNQSKQ